MISRRSFFTGLVAAIAAPAIVRAGSLMPVKSMPSVDDLERLLQERMNEAYRLMDRSITEILYSDQSPYPIRYMIDVQKNISFRTKKCQSQ